MDNTRPAFVTTKIIPGLLAMAALMSVPSPAETLEQGFQNPPDSAKPRVWWHWTGGNVTKEGITKDLEWMKRVGIGGAQAADIGMGGGQTIDKPINFFSDAWFDAIKHAASECDRLGLEMTLFSSSGWSLTGGPWVKPERAMKKLVWSVTDVEGPLQFNEKLPQPPSNTGNFGGLRGLNTGRRGDAGAGRGGRGGTPAPTFYQDSAVIAFRTPPDERSMEQLAPKVTAGSGAEIDAAALMDDNLSTAVSVPAGEDGTAWIQYEFAQPIQARAVTLIGGGGGGRGVPFGQIQVSDDGTNFRTVVELPGAVQYRAGNLKTYAFPETQARFVRVRMTAGGPGPDAVIYQTPPAPAKSYGLAEFIVHTGARVDRWEEKAGFNLFYEYQVAPTPQAPESSSIRLADIVDLTSRMDKDGNLNWQVPPGKWTILRTGYSLVGSMVRAGTQGGAGLEVDKLNARHVEAYFHSYMDPIKERLGPLVGKSLKFMVMDSYEAGMQNWTDDMIEQFTRRRGYDPRPYLAVLTGRVVGSADTSDRFLWDFRRTLADLLAEAHYGTMARMLHEYGMGLYSEAPGVSMEILEDTLLTKSFVDVPMGEFWLGRMHPAPEYYVDVRMAASAAHIYGKQFVATESFTGGGYDPPARYKNLADYWYAQGVNRMIFHSSTHQPLDTKPGNTMVGTHFNRNITWAEKAKPFLDYMGRTQFLLSQGLFVADFAYLLNEGAPSSQPFWGAGLQPTCPEGYDYDTINADVLLNHAKLSDGGRMVLDSGMSYRVLVLPPNIDRIRPELLRRIRELVAGGVALVGPKPTGSPSLQGGYPNADLQVQALAHEIWGDLDGAQRNRRTYGKGLVVWGLPLEQVVGLVTPQMVNPITGELPPEFFNVSIKLPRDAEFAGPLDSDIAWIHRRTDEADVYFVANRTDRPRDIQARFRVAAKEAELWHPDTGEIEPADYAIVDDLTTVPLHLAQRESVFVVFRKAASSPSRTSPQVTTTLATIEGPWDVAFEPNLGAPEKIQLARLESWTANTDDGVKYFSGTATYTRTIQAPPSWFQPGAKLTLDLGAVNDIAEVSINGKPLATLWKPPYRVNLADALKPGENRLEIKVTNQWTNRQMGDRAMPDKRVLSAPGGRGGFGGSGGFGGRGNPSPPESGLLGPVTIVSTTSR